MNFEYNLNYKDVTPEASVPSLSLRYPPLPVFFHLSVGIIKLENRLTSCLNPGHVTSESYPSPQQRVLK